MTEIRVSCQRPCTTYDHRMAETGWIPGPPSLSQAAGVFRLLTNSIPARPQSCSQPLAARARGLPGDIHPELGQQTAVTIAHDSRRRNAGLLACCTTPAGVTAPRVPRAGRCNGRNPTA